MGVLVGRTTSAVIAATEVVGLMVDTAVGVGSGWGPCLPVQEARRKRRIRVVMDFFMDLYFAVQELMCPPDINPFFIAACRLTPSFYGVAPTNDSAYSASSYPGRMERALRQFSTALLVSPLR